MSIRFGTGSPDWVFFRFGFRYGFMFKSNRFDDLLDEFVMVYAFSHLCQTFKIFNSGYIHYLNDLLNFFYINRSTDEF